MFDRDWMILPLSFAPPVRVGDLFCVVDFSAIASESSSIQGEPNVRLRQGVSYLRQAVKSLI